MRVLYIGSKRMGIAGLEILRDFQRQKALKIAGVVARHDDDEKHWYPSVSALARKIEAPLFMPSSMGEESFLQSIRTLKPDIGFCCFYPNLFPEAFFSIPRFGAYNLHFAPLPRYRGALPIPYAIINNEKEHGVTIHRIVKGMDSGPIAAQTLLPIFPDDTGYDLYRRCECHATILFHETVRQFLTAGGRVPTRRQNPEEVISHVRSDLKSLEVQMEWGWEKIHRFVRAFDFPPFDLPFIRMDGKTHLLTVRPDRHGLDASQLPSREFNSSKIYLVEKKP